MPRDSSSAVTCADSEPFVRLADLPARDRHGLKTSTYEDRLGQLIRQSLPAAGLDAAALAKVRQRLDTKRSSVWGAWPPLRWAAVAFAMMLVSSGVVAGTRLLVARSARLSVSPSTASQQIDARRSTPSGRRSGRLEGDAVRPSTSAPAVTKAPAPLPLAKRKLRSLAAVQPLTDSGPALFVNEAEPVAPISPRAPSALAEESASLSRALVLLRQNDDPEGALAQLDEHGRRFPTGVLAVESVRLRVDALLMAGRFGAAESLLRKASLSRTGRDVELKLIRAEIAAKRDCSEAVPLFQDVLFTNGAPRLQERALWGHAACLSQLGDEATTQRALQEYLEHFPNGSHSLAARARLRL